MLIAQRPILVEEPISDTRARYILEPLEPGFGYTLGNSLRRTLLSSIPGAAVTSIRIEGALHEFTTLEGVAEDVTEIVLNIKELVVSSDNDEPSVMYLKKSGPGEVTAADITAPAGVEVHNPKLHIATLNGKGKIEMELVVERGRGYVTAVQNKVTGAEIGRIPVDSIYSPVTKVTYKVEATRVEQRTDFDRLIIDVETKPSMRPADAVASAGRTLVELFGLAHELNVNAEVHIRTLMFGGPVLCVCVCVCGVYCLKANTQFRYYREICYLHLFKFIHREDDKCRLQFYFGVIFGKSYKKCKKYVLDNLQLHLYGYELFRGIVILL